MSYVAEKYTKEVTLEVELAALSCFVFPVQWWSFLLCGVHNLEILLFPIVGVLIVIKSHTTTTKCLQKQIPDTNWELSYQCARKGNTV